MAISNVSRYFKDINLSFKRHPVTGDILALKNEDCIKRSIQNIVLTVLGENPFEPFFGSEISNSLFELATPLTEVSIIEDIKNAIFNFEPRVDGKDVDVKINLSSDTNEIEISVAYNIIGLPVATQQLDFVLQPSRQ